MNVYFDMHSDQIVTNESSFMQGQCSVVKLVKIDEKAIFRNMRLYGLEFLNGRLYKLGYRFK